MVDFATVSKFHLFHFDKIATIIQTPRNKVRIQQISMSPRYIEFFTVAKEGTTKDPMFQLTD